MKKRLLILEDGSVYEGYGFGSDHYQVGELVLSLIHISEPTRP